MLICSAEAHPITRYTSTLCTVHPDQLSETSGHERSLTQIKFNREGDLLFSCSKDHIINVWYSHNGERLGTYDGHNGTVWTVDVDCEFFSPDSPRINCNSIFQPSQDSWSLERLITHCGCGMFQQESVCIHGSSRRR